MIPGISFHNFAAWALQAVLVASVGVLLPLLFRIRHPKSQLVYYHSILILCIVLPLIQPWQDSLLLLPMQFTSIPAAIPTVTWESVLMGGLVLGIAAKLCWLVVGLVHLRRYRGLAVPLSPIPESIREASQLTGTDALFCVSRHVTGPATLGYIDPVVLVPESFWSLEKDAQRSIACHELLHVRRKDWAITLCEELIQSVLWFNPAIWWLLAQAKLSREQLVDSEVVKLTAREPYVRALLSMATVSRRRWSLPAASFFNGGHLVHRMRLLMADGKRSRVRLCVSYVLTATLLALTVCGAFIWLPLIREGQAMPLFGPGRVPRIVFRFQGRPPLSLQQGTGDFTLPVPAPEGPTRDVRYLVSVVPPDSASLAEGILLPPPPPPPPPPEFGFLAARGVRMVRPGEIASPEDIQRLKEAFGERTVIEVNQAPDGTVQRVTVRARRPSDEANAVRSGFATATTIPADRVD
jgi:beta-lactamase regulating signal transducer with metallopeptidase domain